jgi:phosphate starvation-inducible PhoH-like protein
MPEWTISLDSPDEELAVFGAKDQFLRQVRDNLHVKVIARRGEIRVEGDAEPVERARHVFEEMRRIYRRQRHIAADDVTSLLRSASTSSATSDEARMEIRENGRTVRPRTEGQNRYLRALREQELVFSIGPAGTGKTYLAVAVAVSMLRRGAIKKIILVRPAVEAGERLGFLPGDLEAKINPYLRPLLDALHDLMDYNQLRRYMAHDLVEIAPLAYMRGRTLNDAIIILDEGQNATVPQMKMFLTRMGQNARIVVTGDTTQVDVPTGKSGLAGLEKTLVGIDGLAFVKLTGADVVRHRIVADIVAAYEQQDARLAEAQ